MPWVDSYVGPALIEHRNLPETTTCGTAELAFSHPVMQEIVLQAARDAGATVLRGAALRELNLEPSPRAVIELDGRSQTYQARLIVGADGRLSGVRKAAGFVTKADPAERLMSGVLLGDMPVRDDSSHSIFDTQNSQLVALYPQGGGRVRAYFSYRAADRRRLSGEADVPLLIEESIRAGAPADWYAGARARVRWPRSPRTTSGSIILIAPAWCWWATPLRPMIPCSARDWRSPCATCGR